MWIPRHPELNFPIGILTGHTYLNSMPPRLRLLGVPVALVFVVNLWLGTAMTACAENEIRFTVQEGETGVGLPGVAVQLNQPPDSGKTELKTNDAGQCLLPLDEARPRYVTVRVSKEGYVPKLIGWNTDNPEFQLPKDFTLKLDKARTIGGQVVDETGKPIAGAEGLIIIRASSSGRSQEIHNDIWERKVITDADGKWVFDQAPASLDYFGIRLVHPDYVEGDSDGTRIRPQDLLDRTAKRIMKKGRVIEGTVRDTQGNPLKDVSVLMNQHGADSTTQPAYTTDAAGHYFIKNAPLKDRFIGQDGVLLTFIKKGFSPEMSIVPPSQKPTTLDVVLPPGNRLSGRVVDQAGKGIEGVSVGPDYWRKVRPFGCQRLTTDSDGEFVWEDAPADEVVFDLLKDGYLPLRNVPLKTGKETTLTMKRPIPVSAVVVDDKTGSPIPSFTVIPGTLWSTTPAYLARGSKQTGRDGKLVWLFDEAAQRTGRDGKVVDEGTHFLRVESPGYFPADSRAIKDSESAVTLEFRLKKGPDTTIKVVSRSGQPVGGASVVVAGEGNAVSTIDGKIPRPQDWQSVTTGEKGQAILPPIENNPTIVFAHPKFGFAVRKLNDLGQSSVTLTEWGKVVVRSGAIRAGKPPSFYLNYEPIAPRSLSKDRDYYVANRGEITEDGVMVFEGVQPGKVRIGRYRQSDEQAKEVEVPEGKEVEITLPTNDGVANIEGRLVLPESLAGIDWADQRGNLQTSRDPKPWPKGLSIVERRKWLDETPEGKRISKEHRFYFPKIEQDGTYVITDVAAGRYELTVPIFSGKKGTESRTLLGIFQEVVIIPTSEEIAKSVPDHLRGNDDFASTMFAASSNPPFYSALNMGDQLPDFSVDTLSGAKLSKESLKGKKSILVFYSGIPEQFPVFANDINRVCDLAKPKGIEVYGLNTDSEKVMATRSLQEHPLLCEVAWIGSDDNPEWLKKFGPVWSPTILAVNEDGSIRGRFEQVAEALASFEQPPVNSEPSPLLDRNKPLTNKASEGDSQP